MSETSIEWTDKTWNPVRGCKPVSEGCRNCYAETFAARNLPEMRSPTTGKPFAVRTPSGPKWTGAVELVPSKLDEPLRWRKPQRIFVNSMSDLFHESLPFAHIERVYNTMAGCPQHTFQVLTKRPQRRRQFVEWIKESARRAGVEAVGWPLHNVWEGVSVEDQDTADLRISELIETPAAVRFVSYEPGLGPVDFEQSARIADFTPRLGLHWVIVGGESGPGARPFNIAWARSTVAQCRAAGVPVFVKQLGANPYLHEHTSVRREAAGFRFRLESLEINTTVSLRDRKGGDMTEWPEDLRVREFPKGAAA